MWRRVGSCDDFAEMNESMGAGALSERSMQSGGYDIAHRWEKVGSGRSKGHMLIHDSRNREEARPTLS